MVKRREERGLRAGKMELRYSSIDVNVMVELRRCLKRVRVYRGFSPAQLAYAIGISLPTLVQLEHGHKGGDYRPTRDTAARLVAFSKHALPPHPTIGLKQATQDLDRVVTRLATAYGWEEYSRDIRKRPVPPQPKPPEPSKHLFILDDLDDFDDPLLMTPEQKQCEDLLAQIRLNRDPGDVKHAVSDKREALRDAIRQVRDKLELTQTLMQEDHGVSHATLSRLENLDLTGTSLPSRSTLLKLVAVCHRQGHTQDRREAGLPLDSEWHRLAAVLEDAATWERHNKYAPRGKNRRHAY